MRVARRGRRRRASSTREAFLAASARTSRRRSASRARATLEGRLARRARSSSRSSRTTSSCSGAARSPSAPSPASMPVVVLGRSYTIHNDVLNSNVPAILREQGAIAIPVDCYPVPDDAPVFDDVFWGHGQRILRAAWHAAAQPGVYTSSARTTRAGPTASRCTRFVRSSSRGARSPSSRPTATPVTPARRRASRRSSTASARTRAPPSAARRPARSGSRSRRRPSARSRSARSGPHPAHGRRGVRARGGPARASASAPRRCPEPTRDTLRIGRRHTSGKECLPMTVTLGSLLERLERRRGSGENVRVPHARLRRAVPLRRLQGAAPARARSARAGATA